MYIQETVLALIPALLLPFSTIVNGAPTTTTVSDPPKDLYKRDVEPWIAVFSDVGCHTPVSKYHRIITPEGCLAWNSSQPGFYFGVNFGAGDDSRTELQLFLDQGCGNKGPHPLFGGDANHGSGNYVQRAPKGFYSGNAPEGVCFDGVHRSWPVASNGQAFMSLKPDNGPAF